MKEYVIKGMLGDQERRLLVLHPMEGLYQVYWDSLYLGNIEPVIHPELGLYWDSDTEALRGCCQEIGEYIESCDEQIMEEAYEIQIEEGKFLTVQPIREDETLTTFEVSDNGKYLGIVYPTVDDAFLEWKSDDINDPHLVAMIGQAIERYDS